jgi:hypothetical protein
MTWHPYYITASNQLLGGPRTAARTLEVGLGEGMELVAGWLNQQPNIKDVRVLSPLAPALKPYLKRGVHVVIVRSADTMLPDKTGYVVVYIRKVQQPPLDPTLDQFFGKAVPLHTVRIHGIEYAWIYQAPPPVTHTLRAGFGSTIRLYGFNSPDRIAVGQTLPLSVVWEPRADTPLDCMLFVHLIGPDGQRWAQVDLPQPTTTWQPGRYTLSDVPLAIPAGTPPGIYRLVVGLYDLQSGQRLPLLADRPVDPALDGPNALVLTTITVTPE